MSNPYDELMPEVTEVKDLGSGVIDGRECDHLAFRTAEVDWQIWIAQGEAPYPCRYVITSKGVAQAPQYQIDVRDWRTGDAVPIDDFAFEAGGATEVAIDAIRAEIADLPQTFTPGEKQ